MASSRHCCSFDGKPSALSTQHLMDAYTLDMIGLSGYKPYSEVESHHTGGSQPGKSLYTDVGAYFDTPLTAVLAPGARFSSIDHGLLVLFSHGNDSSGGD